jgi:hypothetical protein
VLEAVREYTDQHVGASGKSLFQFIGTSWQCAPHITFKNHINYPVSEDVASNYLWLHKPWTSPEREHLKGLHATFGEALYAFADSRHPACPFMVTGKLAAARTQHDLHEREPAEAAHRALQRSAERERAVLAAAAAGALLARVPGQLDDDDERMTPEATPDEAGDAALHAAGLRANTLDDPYVLQVDNLPRGPPDKDWRRGQWLDSLANRRPDVKLGLESNDPDVVDATIGACIDEVEQWAAAYEVQHRAAQPDDGIFQPPPGKPEFHPRHAQGPAQRLLLGMVLVVLRHWHRWRKDGAVGPAPQQELVFVQGNPGA